MESTVLLRAAVRRTIARLVLSLGITGMAAHSQVTWQTTHTDINGYNSGSCTLVNGSLRVKVFPAYLDVEEDVEIGPGGTVTTGNDPTTLEIVGTFSLPAGASIVGALLWDGEDVLQGKLLDRALADSIYEDLVDRNSTPPPRPRDPLIIEWTGTNAYRLRIYPVVLGRTRHVRLRYQLPPKIGVDGFEIRMQAALIPLFSPSSSMVTVSLVNGGGVDSVQIVESGLKRISDLPRTLFWTRASLTAGAAAGSSALRILPTTPQREVMVKTSFPGGSFSGHYLNLYASVSEEALKALGQRVEVVIFWKWHNPGVWIKNGAVTSYVSTAQSQASQILSLYGVLGVPGTRIGLLHDDSRNPQRAFPTASNTEASYKNATDYLKSIQGAYVEQFARGLQLLPNNGGGTVDSITKSKNRFLDNVRLVKTLYSPDQGITRHLIMVSAGPEYTTPTASINSDFEQVFSGMPLSVSTMKNWGFDQVGFDLWGIRPNHPLPGTMISTTWADVPGFPAMSLVLSLGNAQTTYDFNITCAAALGINCGGLEFHGKSLTPWADSLKWKAYKSDGTFLGAATTAPVRIAPSQDTAIAILWAGSASPFSEKKEPPLGPVYGFVDQWASLLALEQDLLSPELAELYADSGVPRIANENLEDVLPNYEEGQGPIGTGIAEALKSGLRNPASWRLERGSDGTLFLRIPGLVYGLQARIELFDLSGKRVGDWVLGAEAGYLRWSVSGVRSGTYILKVKIAGIQGIKRVLL